MLPEGWKMTNLGELATFKSGGTPSKQNASFWGGSNPWVSAKDLKIHYITSSLDTLTDVGFSAAHVAPIGSSLVLVRGMTLLKDFPVGFATRDVAFNQDLKALVPRAGVDPLFLSYALVASKERIHELVSVAGHGTGKLETDRLKTFCVLLPSLSEQRAIAKVLTTWDETVAITQKLIANSIARKKALMQQLLTGRRRLPGFTGKWRTQLLRTLCDVRRGASPRPISDARWFAATGRGWVRISDVTASEGESLSRTKQYLSKEGEMASVAVDPGDLIMSICATIGVPKFLGIPACIHDGFVVFRNIHSDVSAKFLFHYLEFVSEELAASGQPGTQKNLNTSIVGAIRIPTITLPEQKRIALVISTAHEETLNLAHQLLGLKRARSALLDQLLTGKRRVTLDSAV